jgi:hypothetical protein
MRQSIAERVHVCEHAAGVQIDYYSNHWYFEVTGMGLLERLGLRPPPSAVAVAPSRNGAVEIIVLGDTHTFEAEDGRQIWCDGYSPIDEDGHFYIQARTRSKIDRPST